MRGKNGITKGTVDESKVNALERMLKLVPTQCADVLSDRLEFELGSFRYTATLNVTLFMTRRDDASEWKYLVLDGAEDSGIPIPAQEAARRLSVYVSDVFDIAHKSATHLAEAEAKKYQETRFRDLRKSFSES